MRNLAAPADSSAHRMGVKRRTGSVMFVVVALLATACSSTPQGSTSAAPSAASPAASTPGSSASASSPAASTGAKQVQCIDGTPTRGNGKKQFAWAIGLSELPIIQSMQKRMKQQASLCGWEVLFDTGTAGNIQSMIPSVEAWVTAGVPSITVAPFEPAAWEQLAKRTVDKGLIWISYNQSTKTRFGTFGFGPCDAAKLMSEGIVKHIKADDPNAVVFISTNIANPAVACKWDDIKRDIEAQTSATVLPFQDANNGPDALKVLQAVLQAHPDLSVAIGTNGDAGQGMEQALKAAGKDPAKFFLASYDGAEQNLREIKAGGGFAKLDIPLSLIDLADLIVAKNMELALGNATTPPADPPNYDVPVFSVMNGDPKIDELLADYDLLK